jgi:putative ABC transport system permease protein
MTSDIGQKDLGQNMFNHYLKIALRNIRKHKSYAFINVFGLALGVACCVLVFLFVQHERSYDRFHENGAQIYRVNLSAKKPDGSVKLQAGQPAPLALALKSSFPEITNATRLGAGSVVIRFGEASIKERALYADVDFFKMFSFPLLHGEAATALANKNALVLSEALAQKYFANDNPLGKTLTLNFGDKEQDFIVSAVAQKIPSNSSIDFDLVLPYENSPNYNELENLWTSWGTVTFIQTATGVQPAALQSKFKEFVKTRYGAMIKTWEILGWLAKEKEALQLELQPLTALHLDARVESGAVPMPTSSPTYSYILAGIGLIVLLIACINFMTLAIGRAASRTREVGMRKTLGALRSQLLKQFWGEAMLFSFFALLLGVALAEFFLPLFNALANKALAIDYLGDWKIYAVFVVLMISIGLMAGGYPAIFLSRFQPVATLKNKTFFGGKNRLSQTLIVAQFSLSVLLVVCAIIMSNQLDLLKTHQPGFNEEQVVVIPTNARDAEGEKLLQLYHERLAGQSRVHGVTGNSDGFYKETAWMSFGGNDGATWQVNVMRVDPDFIKTFGMEILQGRDFSREMTADFKKSVIVNETLVKELGWKEPVGHVFSEFATEELKKPEVIGVIKDFNYASLHERVKPLVLLLDPSYAAIRYLYVKLAPGNFSEALALLQNNWREIAPSQPFDYYFLDADFDQRYRAEERWAHIVAYAMLFAIAIACIGLFGLSALTVAKRTKEIGIRKVLGASIFSVVRLLTKEFVLLIALANLLAWPVAYFAMQQWLQDFAYRINVSLWPFILSGIFALGAALLTVSFQAVKAALANPVEALRYE